MTLVGILLASFLLACELADPVDEIRHFEDSLMVNILTDAFVLQAAFADTYGDVKDSMATVYSRQLLTKYNISKEELEYNIERIFEDPIRADSILQKILDRVDYLERNIDFESEENNPLIK